MPKITKVAGGYTYSSGGFEVFVPTPTVITFPGEGPGIASRNSVYVSVCTLDPLVNVYHPEDDPDDPEPEPEDEKKRPPVATLPYTEFQPRRGCKDSKCTDTEFKDFITCYELQEGWGYQAGGESGAFSQAKRQFGNDIKKGTRAWARQGPCKPKGGTPMYTWGWHVNVLRNKGGDAVKSLLCCPCCEDKDGGVRIKFYCRLGAPQQ